MLLIEITSTFVAFEHEYLISFSDSSIEQKVIDLRLSWDFFQLVDFRLYRILRSRVIVRYQDDVSSLMV